MNRVPVFWGSSVEEICCIVQVSSTNYTVFRNVRVKIRNSGGGNGIGRGHSVLRWAVAGGHDSALIATSWITPCICYQACNCNAINAIIFMQFILANIHHQIERGGKNCACN